MSSISAMFGRYYDGDNNFLHYFTDLLQSEFNCGIL